MPFELSLPVKIAALAGLALALAGGAFLLLFGKHHAASPGAAVVAPARHVHAADDRATAKAHRAATHAARPAHATSDPSLPAPLRQALAKHELVVAILYSPAISIDAGELAAGRQAAAATHAGLALLDLAGETTAAAVASSFPDASDPAVLIVRRPGKVVSEFDGLEDAQTVAQAVLDARGR